MSEATIRFLLADDHVLVRKGIIKILEEAFPSSVFGEASDAAQAIAHVLREKWDIALLDLSMPGRSGFDLINDLKQIAPSLPLLVLTMYTAEQVALRAYKAGAAGYLTKESVARRTRNCNPENPLRKKYIPPLIADLLADEMGRKNDTTKAIDLLSDREYEVFLKNCPGQTLTDIAKICRSALKPLVPIAATSCKN
jgi:DNA-binding NarL/FixJ family response regulator